MGACSDENGGMFVTYADYNTGGTSPYSRSLFLKHFDQFGIELIQTPTEIDTLTWYIWDNAPSLTSDGCSGLYIGYTQDSLVQEIEFYPYFKGKAKVQRISNNGEKMWGDEGIQLSINSRFQSALPIATTSSYDLIVGWNEWDELSLPDTNNFFINKLSDYGISQWGAEGIQIGEPDTKHTVEGYSILPDGSGGAIISYEEENIYKIQRVSESGESQWIIVVPHYKSIVSDLVGGILVVESRFIESSNYELYINKIDSEGNLTWSEAGLFIDYSNQPFNNNSLSIYMRPDSTVVCHFTKTSGGSTQSYLQYVSFSGNSILESPLHTSSELCGTRVARGMVGSNENSTIFVMQDDRDAEFKTYCTKISSNGQILWDSNDILFWDQQILDGILLSDQTDGLINIAYGNSPTSPQLMAQKISVFGNIGEVVPLISTIGDINSDGSVNILDVVIVVAVILGDYEGNDYELQESDVNCDGTIDVLDIVYIVDIILNM